MIRVVHPRSGSRIRILTLTLHIPDSGVKKAPDSGSGSATCLPVPFLCFVRQSNLVGNVLNVNTGDWVRRDSGVGAGIDSYYEYVAKVEL
jgi:hypothetical protein